MNENRLSPDLSYIEVCAGAGGLGLGLQRAGWHGMGVELDPNAAESHRQNVGPCITVDATTFSPDRSALLAVGGVPCPPFSPAGKRLGLDDPRGRLFESLLRVAKESSAEVVLLENVEGMARMGIAKLVAAEFERDGYFVKMTLLNAADFGVPQFRRRVFMVGFRDRKALERFRFPEPTHGPRGNIFGLPAHVTVREALSLPVLENVTEWIENVLDRPARTVRTTPRGRGTLEYITQRGHEDKALPFLRERIKRMAEGGSELSGQRDDALSVMDCAILQGFPQTFRFSGILESQYRQVGNAVPPALGEAVGRAIRQALGK